MRACSRGLQSTEMYLTAAVAERRLHREMERKGKRRSATIPLG